MTVGDDIKNAYIEVGTSYTIVRDSGNVTGEFLDFELNRQVTKPFIREYFIEASLAYDSQAIAGDVIRFGDGRNFLIMNMTPENFENAIISKESVLYKCNVSGELHRFSGEIGGWDEQTYEANSEWETVSSDVYGLITEKLFGTELDQDEELGQLEIESGLLYVASNKGVQPLDRYYVGSGEYFKVEAIEKRKFDGVDVCHIVEDTRQ